MQTRECEFCDRKFKYKKSFVHHMQVEHGMSDVGSDIDDKTEDLPLSANNNDNKNGDNVGKWDIQIQRRNTEV